MAIYEYRCRQCQKRYSLFLRGFNQPAAPVCPNCGSTAAGRLVSRFAVVKSEDRRADDLTDPSKFGDVDENDPKSIARFARKMGSELGEDMPPEFDEMVDRLEAGENPEDVERSMGMGEGGEGMGGMGGMGDDLL
jgi:putative FmdB family regulatory protein